MTTTIIEIQISYGEVNEHHAVIWMKPGNDNSLRLATFAALRLLLK
jgi:hypothetical protein